MNKTGSEEFRMVYFSEGEWRQATVVFAVVCTKEGKLAQGSERGSEENDHV